MEIDSGRYHLQWAGVVGMLPLPAMVVGFALGQFPWPDDNLDGGVYLDYELPRHFGEIGTLVWLVLTGASVMFLWLLAIAHIRRNAQLSASVVVMIAGGGASAAAALVFASSFVTIAVMGRGYPVEANGEDHAASMVITYSWNLTEICFALNTVLLGLIWFAVAAANRRHRLLPTALTHAAVGVAVIDVVGVVSVFVPTGAWSPGSFAQVLPGAAATYLWIMAAAVILLRRHGFPAGPTVTASRHHSP
ncbi:hypothetical protein ACIRRA_39540 [Nocardia sp. NPDC101769]|uniref:hypothetical protein n=1 Tax=Nocardia sp. NPDC101769 TaxID=3364333 RepID=UPI003824D9EE